MKSPRPRSARSSTSRASTSTRCSARPKDDAILLPSFGTDLSNAVVIGASGGIGVAFIEQTVARQPLGRKFHRAGASRTDLTQPASIAAACANITEPVDLVLVATGMLQRDTWPRTQGLAALDAHWLAQSFAVNAIGPALVAQALLPKLRRDHKTAFAALSSARRIDLRQSPRRLVRLPRFKGRAQPVGPHRRG